MNITLLPLLLLLLLLLVISVASVATQECSLQCQHGGLCKLGSKSYDFMIHPNHTNPDALKQFLGEESSPLGEYCDCPPPYTGLICNVKVTFCKDDGSHTCFHGGDCAPTSISSSTEKNAYICDCRKAEDENGVPYVGKYCEYPVTAKCSSEEEENDFCANGGLCEQDGSCICPPKYLGNHCEYHVGTVPSQCTLTCLNGGYCRYGFRDATPAEDALERTFQPNIDFQHCVCSDDVGFVGASCEIQVDSCETDGGGENDVGFCLYGGECESVTDPSTLVTTVYCNCAKADHEGKIWSGLQCEDAITSFCTTNETSGDAFCTNGGICVYGENGTYNCECPDGYSGARCEFAEGQGGHETMAPSMSPTNLVNNPRFCFSGSNLVEVENEGPTPMRDLRIGDSVRVGPKNFEQIYSFGHRHATIVAEYLRVKTANEVLELTPDHMVFSEGKPIAASMLKLGDNLDLADGTVGKVECVDTVHETGIFAPFTPSGMIVVGGIVSSTFTTLEKSASAELTIGGEGGGRALSTGISYQWIGLAFETPFRLICSRFGSCPDETYTETGLSTRLVLPVQAGAWFAEQSSVVARVLFVIPILSILFFFYCTETILTVRLTVVLFPPFMIYLVLALIGKVNVRATKAKQA